MGSRALRMVMGAAAPFAAALWLACGEDYTAAPLPEEPVFLEDEAAAPRDSAPPVLGADGGGGDAANAPDVVTFCDTSTPFQTIAALAGSVNTALDDAFPTLTDDELLLYFQRGDVGGASNPTFFVAQRATRTADFGAPVQVSELADGLYNSFPSVTSKGDLLYFGGAAAGVPANIRVAKSVGVGRFAAATDVPGLSAPDVAENFPALFAGGDELWFSAPGDAGALHFRRAPLYADGGVGTPQSIPELESTGYESGLASTRDGLTIYFGSPRVGGQGGGDIWMASRTSRGLPFSNLATVTAVNTTFDEQPGWLSPDACRLYFTTSRLGTFDIYVATRPKP